MTVNCPSCKGTKAGGHLEQVGKDGYHCHYCGADFINSLSPEPEIVCDYLNVSGQKWLIGVTRFGKYEPRNRELLESYLEAR